MYYLALGHYKLGNMEDARKFNREDRGASFDVLG